MVKKIIFLLMLCWSSFGYSEDSTTKGVLIDNIVLQETKVVSAQLSALSPAAIERGLKDATLIASPTYDKKTQLLALSWHSVSKTINGTEYAQKLDSPLKTVVKLEGETSMIPVGQELTIKGDLQSFLTNFDEMVKRSETKVENSTEENTTNKTIDSNASTDSGKNGSGYLSTGGLSESPSTDDLEVNVDNITSKTEACSNSISYESLTISKQERVVKYNEAGDVVETGSCTNVGSPIPLEKDFGESCSVQINGLENYIRGYTLYAYVDGQRVDASGCRYDAADSTPLDIRFDFAACDVADSEVNLESSVYYPQGVKYITIDGTRYNLTDCVSITEKPKALPTSTEQCSPVYDFDTAIASDQERVLTLSPDGKSTLKAGACVTTNTYDIQRDFDVGACVDLPDYNNQLLALGYRPFIVKNESKEYIGDCDVDLAKTIPIYNEIDTCQATENLTTLSATINKKWFYDAETGEKVAITDCVATDEVYSIEDTTNTCSPQVLTDLNKVVMQYRKAWTDSNNVEHYVTSCTPSDDNLEIKTEVCENPKYEHDYVGGTSYLLTRKYYEFDGENNYLTSCAREPSISFPHTVSSDGCQNANDDENLQTVLYQKTYAELEEGQTLLKDCAPSMVVIPYTKVNDALLTDNYIPKTREWSPYSQTFSQYMSGTVSKYYSGASQVTIWKTAANKQFEIQPIWITLKRYVTRYQRLDSTYLDTNIRFEAEADAQTCTVYTPC